MLSTLGRSLVFAGFVSLTISQQLARDPCEGGTPIEVVHLYYDEYPQGLEQRTPLHFGVMTLTPLRYSCLLHRPKVLQLRPLFGSEQRCIHSRRVNSKQYGETIPERRNQ